jgi:hypothetical protein
MICVITHTKWPTLVCFFYPDIKCCGCGYYG